MSTETIATLTVTYIGRRLLQGNKLGYFYQWPDGTEKGYAKNMCTSVRVGALLQLTLADDGESWWVSGANAPQPIGFTDSPHLPEWVATDTADAQTKANRDALNRYAKSAPDALGDAIEILRTHAQTLRTAQSRAAFITHITTQILA